MLNTEDFIKRLEELMQLYGLTASIFADKIGVQRSGISHILSGRNKPSLDFVLKITDVFPEVDLYWLLNGKGSALQNGLAPALTAESKTSPASIESDTQPSQKSPVEKSEQSDRKIYKIVIFYSDGSFSDFTPSP